MTVATRPVYECAKCGDGTPGFNGSRACEPHYRETIERLKKPGRPGPKTGKTIAGRKGTARKESDHRPNWRDIYNAERTAEAKLRAAARADQIAEFVNAAGSWPVKSIEVKKQLGAGVVHNSGVKLAIKQGRIVSYSNGPPELRGYYPAGWRPERS